MSYQMIPLSKLAVNFENDRHGPVEDETKALNWHFKNLKTQAAKLAKDIVEQRTVYEPPLVSRSGAHYVVRDGNRRVTCLKALANPKVISDHTMQKQFAAIGKNADPKLFKEIECRVEEDEDKINEIVHRRHTGGASGVGQVKWGAVEKENYLRRIGKVDLKSVGFIVAEYAKKERIVPSETKIPTSTLKRLLSSKDIRDRIGIRVDGADVYLIGDEAQIKKTLRQIIEDLASKQVTLKDLWANADKHRYLDALEKDGYHVPKVPEDNGADDKKKGATGKGRSPHSKFALRPTLIPKDLELNIDATKPGLSKIRRVWDELQTRLYINTAPCAVGVMFRCLLELATEHYISRKKMKDLKSDFHVRVKAVADHMHSQGSIDDKYRKQIEKLSTSEHTVSVRTFHDFVHSSHLIPSEQNLRTLWENFEVYVISCLES